ncbi:IclR family transcriptional regulator [Cypionkella aquatica]|uniref:IclR family transcriptional regulator n=1 Tax=Cypionkella aquatica TaxID=1756042 RepID=A0AA37X2A6_9RHOB|nr:IclR family transcriptional regulator [Cypionkella aquatica]GLS85986.1 IclR family transcriptional regulator [Cypionkella aquatica]
MRDNQQDGTVGKALDVLEMVAARAPVRFSDLMAQGGYPKATLYRLLQTLTHQGMLAYDEARGSYSLGLRLVRLAHGAWSQSALAPLARQVLDRLAQATGETVHLAQMDQGQVLYVDKRNATRPVEMFSQAGKVGPAYCTGVGKAMLAFMKDAALTEALARQSFHRFTAHTLDASALRAELETIRQRGYAFDREEHEAGIICVAVPILTGLGRMIGALSVTSSTARSSLPGLEAQVPALQQAASDIGAEAESWRFPESS